MEKYRVIIENAKQNGNWFRLGKTFRTSKDFFFLDTGTGKVFKVKESIFRVLDCLFKTNNFNNLYKINLPNVDLVDALDEICEAITTQHLFSAPPLSRGNIHGNHLHLEERLKNEMSSLTLELTERCNLRCKYCLYGETNDDYRTFGQKEMTLETAQKAIDFLMSHSKLDKQIYIGFYGGEPLLRYPFIKKIIEYIRNKYPDRNVGYSITSNMTLMTEEIAVYLANIKGMSLVVSMDGPEELHDMNRVYPDGTGSFSQAMRGLETYMSEKENSTNKDIPNMFSVVIDTPYNSEKFEKMNRFFKTLGEKYVFDTLISYVSSTAYPEEYIEITDRPENEWTDSFEEIIGHDPLISWTFQHLDDSKFSMGYLKRDALLTLHNRGISDMPIDNYALNGCCVPGARRLYVTAEGNFLPCERIGTQLPIGNVQNGFDIDYIKQNYVDDFIEQEIKYCGECWAINICNNCYMDCFGKDHIDFSYRHRFCNTSRKRISESLSIYHEAMDRYPEMVNALNDVIIE